MSVREQRDLLLAHAMREQRCACGLTEEQHGWDDDACLHDPRPDCHPYSRGTRVRALEAALRALVGWHDGASALPCADPDCLFAAARALLAGEDGR